MPDLGGRRGVAPLANTRSSPAPSVLPVADQRAMPDRASNGMRSGTTAPSTPVRAVSAPPSSRAMATAVAGNVGSLTTLAGVVVALVPLRSPVAEVVTKHANGGDPGSSSNPMRCRSGAVVPSFSNSVFGSALRKAGNRSSAESSVAARWTQAGLPHAQVPSNTTRRARRAGSARVARFAPRSSTTPPTTSSTSFTSTAPSSTSVRPRVRVPASNTRPRSSEEYGVGIRDSTLWQAMDTGPRLANRWRHAKFRRISGTGTRPRV